MRTTESTAMTLPDERERARKRIRRRKKIHTRSDGRVGRGGGNLLRDLGMGFVGLVALCLAVLALLNAGILVGTSSGRFAGSEREYVECEYITREGQLSKRLWRGMETSDLPDMAAGLFHVCPPILVSR